MTSRPVAARAPRGASHPARTSGYAQVRPTKPRVAWSRSWIAVALLASASCTGPTQPSPTAGASKDSEQTTAAAVASDAGAAAKADPNAAPHDGKTPPTTVSDAAGNGVDPAGGGDAQGPDMEGNDSPDAVVAGTDTKITYLVWETRGWPSNDDDLSSGKPGPAMPMITTRWIEASPSGFSELGKREGLWLATDVALFQLIATPVKFKTANCPDWEGEEGGETSTRKSSFTAFKLTLKGSDGSTQAIYKPGIVDEPDAMGSFEEAFEPSAGLGPLLFLRRTENTYACGAHGDYHSTALGWNAATESAIEVPAKQEAEGLVSTYGDKAREILRARDTEASEDISAGAPGSSLSVSTFAPWINAGKLRLDVLFTGDTCYACSDGLWSAYTESALVSVDTLPEALRGYERVPAPVSAALGPRPSLAQAKDPALSGGFGWSRVPATGTARDAVAREFTPKVTP